MKPTPILLVGGFLGAGKTTLINQLLQMPNNIRIAAIVNDFGAINIDAALLAEAAKGVVSLKNGCICCTLQGDLLRSLSTVMKRAPRPDAIVIETSGVSDARAIIQSLLDPVIFRATPLDTVATLVDVVRVSEDLALWQDPLWASQVEAADILLLSKTSLIGHEGLAEVRQRLTAHYPHKPVFESEDKFALEHLFSHSFHRARSEEDSIEAPVRPPFTSLASPRFATMTWTSRRPLSLENFQQVLNYLSMHLLRAKGVMVFAESTNQPVMVQLVGARATITQSPIYPSRGLKAELVMIARSGSCDWAFITAMLDETVMADYTV